METKQKLQNALKNAMRNGDTVGKRTIRSILSNIKLAEVDKGTVDETAIAAILQKEIKLRQEAINEAKKANRTDLIEENESEIKVIKEFLPEQLSKDEIQKIVNKIVEEIGASSLKEMGQVMKAALPKIAGRAPNSLVSQIVKEALTQ